MSETDPYTQVYGALHEMLFARTALHERIVRGNRLRYDDTSSPRQIKTETLDKDFPSISLLPISMTYNTHTTSATAQVIAKFQIVIASGVERVDERVFPIEFEVFRAFCSIKAHLHSLTWKDKQFVIQSLLLSSTQGISEKAAQGGRIAWLSRMDIEIQMRFSRTDLATEGS